MSCPPFHLAFPVHDLEAARRFYGEVLGCREGRRSERWVDFDFHGHQIVAHLVKTSESGPAHNPVDGHEIPVPHFGVVLEWKVWEELGARLRERGTEFVVEPYLRFEGLAGEQGTFFVRDPSGNTLEFKSFQDPRQLFAREEELRA